MKMSKMNSSLDPITLEIMFNALRSIADETFITLMKSAYSTNIKERRDHSTAIMDKSGRLIVQADASLPVHLASMGGLMISLLEKYNITSERIVGHSDIAPERKTDPGESFNWEKYRSLITALPK